MCTRHDTEHLEGVAEPDEYDPPILGLDYFKAEDGTVVIDGRVLASVLDYQLTVSGADAIDGDAEQWHEWTMEYVGAELDHLADQRYAR